METAQSPTQSLPAHAPGYLPPNLTGEQVKSMFLRFQSMRQQGVPDNNPEFLKLRNILANVQRHNQMVKERKDKTLADSKIKAAEQNGVAPDTNGTSTAKPDSAPNGVPNGTASNAQESAAEPPKQPNSFSTDQIAMLRTQIAAFKNLSKNLPLPPPIRNQLFNKREPSAAGPQSATSAAASVQGASTSQELERIDKYKYFITPYSRRSDILLPEMRMIRGITPSATPLGVDVSRLMEDRDVILYNRLEHRRKELADLNANVASWNTKSSESQREGWDVKRRLVIEYKKLNLAQRQRNLRTIISREMVHADNMAMMVNRSQFRRAKRLNPHDAKMTEKLEKQQRDARQDEARKKYYEYIHSVLHHHVELRKATDMHRQKTYKLGRMMLQQHQILEKEEQRRIERTAKQRLQALKANDEETYLKLLGQAKDTRISHLLSQTDGFLNQLAASVKAQQRTAAHQYRDRDHSLPDSDSEEEADEEGGGRVDYYEVAHRIKEEVHQQSSNLVGGTLKEYQVKGLQWMISLYNNNLNGILADEMGLGKTIQTISLITYLIETKGEHGPFLVIVPLSTLTNWNNEFEKWAPSVKRIVYKGPPVQRKLQQQQIRWGQFQVLLTTYEFVIKDRPILSKVKWLHMIVDEGHRMKNSKSKLSSTITEYYVTRYRVILTGTPLQNNLPELWALLNFVLPNIFKSVKSFDEWFNTPFANTGGQDKMELSEEEQLLVIRRLHKVLRPFLLRRLKKDVEKDLPDKTERVVKCNFSALQAKLYKQLATDQKLMIGDGKGGKTGMRGLSNMLMQLRKVCNHPFVYEQIEDQINPGRGTNDLIWRTAGKVELLDRILPKFLKTGHRVLMFFQMTQIMNIMEDFMRYRGMTYLRLDGSTKSDERSDLLRMFNAPNSPYFCFLLSTRAGGLGLNLQTADTVIIYDSDWNPHQDLQAQDRAHRIGQKNEVRILRLITSNSIEEKILERANFKLDMDGKVIQAGRFDNKSTEKEREAMLRIMLESAETVETVEQDEMDDEELNVMMMRSEEELEIFTKMDEERARHDYYGPKKNLPRLMVDSELPDIYVNDDPPVVETEAEENFGRGARERTRVRYDDGLTEEQWLEAVDNSDDNIEDAIKRKDAKKARRAANKDKRTSTGGGTSSPAGSRESSASPEPVPKKRGRKPKGGGSSLGATTPAEKRKFDDALDSPGPESAGPARKRGRGASAAATKMPDVLGTEERARLQRLLTGVYDDLMELEEESADDEIANRDIIGMFRELPDRGDYPDYYVIIANPICMAQIKKKITRREYQAVGQFLADVRLLCDNCRLYNEDGSVLFQDANLIEETAMRKLLEEAEASGDPRVVREVEEAVAGLRRGSASGESGSASMMASSVGTPLALAAGR